MPSFTEAATLDTVIRRVLASPYVQELIVVDDGSNDATIEIVTAIDEPRIRLLVQPINLGKGAASEEPSAGGDVTVDDATEAPLRHPERGGVEYLERCAYRSWPIVEIEACGGKVQLRYSN